MRGCLLPRPQQQHPAQKRYFGQGPPLEAALALPLVQKTSTSLFCIAFPSAAKMGAACPGRLVANARVSQAPRTRMCYG